MFSRKSLQIAIRFDGGGAVGFGHATRCAALARTLRITYGIPVKVYAHEDPVLMAYLAKEQISFLPFSAETSERDIFKSIAEDAANSLLLVDRLYAYREDDFEAIRHRMPLCMLHNECEGMRVCDAVIFPVGHLSDEKIYRYRSQVRPGGFYSGFEYVLLGDDCLRIPRNSNNGFLTLASGASDPRGVLMRLLEWSSSIPSQIQIKALYGNSFMWKDALQEWMKNSPKQVSAEEFSSQAFFRSRCSICAFGVSVYELIYHAIPFLTVAHIPKTAEGSAVLAKKIGLPVDLGLLDDLTPQKFAAAVEWMIQPDNEDLLRRKIIGLVDGKGVDRVAEIVYKLL